MSSDAPPIGQRFSHVYVERGTPNRDSERVRRRLYYLLDKVAPNETGLRVLRQLRLELGLKITRSESFFTEAGIKDVLDSITIIWKTLKELGRPQAVDNWLNGCRTILHEEHLGYRIDEAAGVHCFIDVEFSRNSAATIAGLHNARYAGVLQAFESANAALDEHPKDGKRAIRDTFEATEILFRLMFPKAQRLGVGEIASHLKPLVDRTYADDTTGQRAMQKLVNSFADWVEGAHFYRHGQGREEPVQPPIELAVCSVSVGASFLRWLGDLDQVMSQE